MELRAGGSLLICKPLSLQLSDVHKKQTAVCSMSVGHICFHCLSYYSQTPQYPPSIPLFSFSLTSPLCTHARNSPLCRKMDGMFLTTGAALLVSLFAFFTARSSPAFRVMYGSAFSLFVAQWEWADVQKQGKTH